MGLDPGKCACHGQVVMFVTLLMILEITQSCDRDCKFDGGLNQFISGGELVKLLQSATKASDIFPGDNNIEIEFLRLWN